MQSQAGDQACGFVGKRLQVQIISLSNPVSKHGTTLTFSHFSLCLHVLIELIIRKHAIFHFVSKIFQFFFPRQSLMYSRLTCSSLCIQAVKHNLRRLILLSLPPQFYDYGGGGIAVPDLGGARDRTQGFTDARQASYPSGHLPNLLLSKLLHLSYFPLWLWISKWF